MKKTNQHYGDYSSTELNTMSHEKLIEIIIGNQNDDNFIIMSDSYKMTHHLLYPEGLKSVYSSLEARGGEMPYTVFVLLQYYIKRYIAGRRITHEKIEEAHQANIAHFGFDCFDDTMWKHICEKHDGKLPLIIRAVPEGTPVAVKNILMDIENTDMEHCAALTNITETLLMKLWAGNTVATYNRIIKELITRYHAMTSDLPAFLIDYMHHDFGYRGCSSEETARLMSVAAMTSFKGTDTMGGLSLIKKYYSPDNASWSESMAGFSVIASEHSVHCSYISNNSDPEGYRSIINRIKNHPKIRKANPLSGVIILSLVSDTKNIYNICYRVLPDLKDEFIGWTNDNGIPIKIVIRPDSGVPANVLFGYNYIVNKLSLGSKSKPPRELITRVAEDMGIDVELAGYIVQVGIFEILFEKFGCTKNSKGYRVFHPQIGCLQGDGVKMSVIEELYKIMTHEQYKIDIMMLNFGSGGKNLQAHDRDEQKYAIKATRIKIQDETGAINNVCVQKNPVTDEGKKSKTGYQKLVIKQITDDPSKAWMNYVTMQEGDEGFDTAENVLVPVFMNGEILTEYSFDEIRENCKVI